MKTRPCPALLLIAALLLLPQSLMAAGEAGGAWVSLYGSGNFHQDEKGPWRYGFYGDARRTERLNGINQYTLQPGAGFRINSRVSLWTGYTYFRSEIVDGPSLNEHRSWQQVSWNMLRWGGGTVKSRTRLEQRFRAETREADLRLRQQFRWDAPLSWNRDVSFILGDEMFYHVRDTDWTRQGFGQNRFYTGLGWDYHNLKLEALYIHQLYTLGPLPDKANHLLVLNFRM